MTKRERSQCGAMDTSQHLPRIMDPMKLDEGAPQPRCPCVISHCLPWCPHDCGKRNAQCSEKDGQLIIVGIESRSWQEKSQPEPSQR
jgi:hypothetical protein